MISGNHTLYHIPDIRGSDDLSVGLIRESLINLHAPFTVIAIPVVCGGSDWNLPLPEKIAPTGNRDVDVGIESDWNLALPERIARTGIPHRKIRYCPTIAYFITFID